jgi:hypothetical protein
MKRTYKPKRTGMSADQDVGDNMLRKAFKGGQTWKRKVQSLHQAMSHSNSTGGQQYLEAHIEGQLQSGPVKQLSREEIAALEDQYRR